METFIFVVGCIGCIALGVIAIVLVAVFIIDYLRTRRDSHEDALREVICELRNKMRIVELNANAANRTIDELRNEIQILTRERDELREIANSVGHVICEPYGVDTTKLNQA